ncbi:protein NYNRIN-like [Conger conger]|uniref:protein NYNRIN-like n=1 Tax=Conger conger TaxID=82655 RepID=UPI002A5A2ED6|nr:protein NYNRIN-like [Conger conger]
MEKTYERILARFYWPGVKKAVEDYCRHCAVCQLHSPKVTLRNPLIPLPVIDVPFRRIAMDILGPLPKSSRGHRYILVILDYATRYPEAVPLRTATGKAVARELFLLFSRVWIAEELLTDQGSCFMSGVLKEMCRLLQSKRCPRARPASPLLNCYMDDDPGGY